ncbi:MAG: hypothetical protein WEE20_09180, partial [Bacteroidota bacterium]
GPAVTGEERIADLCDDLRGVLEAISKTIWPQKRTKCTRQSAKTFCVFCAFLRQKNKRVFETAPKNNIIFELVSQFFLQNPLCLRAVVATRKSFSTTC